MTQSDQSTQSLSPDELAERISVLNRLRQLLVEQRSKFQDYLTVLEKQEFSISEQDTEKLLAHTELEQHLVGNIANLQRVIKPMEELYKFSHLSDDDIPMLKTDLSKLQEQILVQNEKNRTTLRTHIDSIQTKIRGLQNPYRNTRSVYAQSAQTASIINIEG